MKPVLFIVGMLLSDLAFSQGYLDKIKEKVGETVWSKIPEVSVNYGNLNAFEPDYPIFSPEKIPDEGMMLFTLPSGRKGLAFRYDILKTNQIPLWYAGGLVTPEHKAVVETIFQRYSSCDYNFAPSGGVRWYLGTTGGCGDDTIDRVVKLIKHRVLHTKDDRILLIK